MQDSNGNGSEELFYFTDFAKELIEMYCRVAKTKFNPDDKYIFSYMIYSGNNQGYESEEELKGLYPEIVVSIKKNGSTLSSEWKMCWMLSQLPFIALSNSTLAKLSTCLLDKYVYFDVAEAELTYNTGFTKGMGVGFKRHGIACKAVEAQG